MEKWTKYDIETLNDNIHKNVKEIILILDNKFSKKSIMMKINRLGLHDNYFKYETFRNCKISKEYLLQEYLKNPKLCKCCDKIIDYELRNINIFCDSSCSGKFNSKFKIGLKYNLSEKGLENLRLNAYNNFHKNKDYKKSSSIKRIYKKKNREKKVKRNILKKLKKDNFCKNCNITTTNKSFCSTKCWSIYIFKNKPEFEKYKLQSKFKFSLTNYPNKFDFTLIEKYGWYSPSNSNNPNPNGISRDHMYSVKDGFLNNINPNIICHPANCELMPHTENQKKKTNSSITLEELIQRIENW